MNGSSSAVAVLCAFWPNKRYGSTALLRKSDAKVVVIQHPGAEAAGVACLYATLGNRSMLTCVLA